MCATYVSICINGLTQQYGVYTIITNPNVLKALEAEIFHTGPYVIRETTRP